MLNSALNNILHHTGAENFFVQMLKIGLADGKTMGKTGNIPVKVWHVIDTGAKHSHLLIVRTKFFIRQGMELFTQLHEEQLQIKIHRLLPIVVGGISFISDVFNKQGKIIDIVKRDNGIKGNLPVFK